ncbi:hypothetical protein [Maridesulfovibrio sp. FT414]|uniref:hypothetical protein n=1 Tax=Maridesulfovibrio sp. FT414 TaxID=2979469 RepID=UPI003D8089FB
MRNEIILKNTTRPLFMALCIIVATIVTSVISTGFSFTAPEIFRNYLPFIIIGTGGIILLWQLVSLQNNETYLETSDDGLMINGSIRRYIPWTNVRDIQIDDAMLASVQNDVAQLADQRTLIFIDLYDPHNVFFDNIYHKISAKFEKQLNDQFSTIGNRIPLNLYLMTDLSQETMCMLLRKRWQRAINR